MSHFGPRPQNSLVAMETNGLRSFLNPSQIFLSRLGVISRLITVSYSFLFPMVTVAKVAGPKYFSCRYGPMAQHLAKFHRDPTKNERKIMFPTSEFYYNDVSICLLCERIICQVDLFYLYQPGFS